jgi:hypothetical protein
MVSQEGFDNDTTGHTLPQLSCKLTFRLRRKIGCDDQGEGEEELRIACQNVVDVLNNQCGTVGLGLHHRCDVPSLLD